MTAAIDMCPCEASQEPRRPTDLHDSILFSPALTRHFYDKSDIRCVERATHLRLDENDEFISTS